MKLSVKVFLSFGKFWDSPVTKHAIGTRVVLIGHRGVGKTELLGRLKKYFPQYQYFDLDLEIAKKTSNPVSKIFEAFGEDYFRSKEIEVVHELLNKKDIVVSCGAGFKLDILPEEVKCIWVRRVTDSDGRIFVNRPALDSRLNPLDDYFARFEKRNKKFYDRANFIYDMPEGIHLLSSDAISKKGLLIQEKNLFKDILFQTIKKKKGVLTINSRNLNEKLIFDTIELRSDIFSARDIIRLVGDFRKKSKIILSFRKDKLRDLDELSDVLTDVDYIDIEVQLVKTLESFIKKSTTAEKKKLIISCHIDLLTENIRMLENSQKGKIKTFLKCSPIIRSFAELKQLFDWHQSDPKNRFIFPRSSDGDWQWFRSFMLQKQNINFISDGFSGIPDQPTILDAFLFDQEFTHFSAIIGNPVNHSYSPAYHFEYMKKRNCPYFKIKIEERDFNSAMDFLESLGMRAASITSPFKESTYRKYQKQAEKEIKLKSVNTLIFDSQRRIELTNTDRIGILKTLTRIEREHFKNPLSKLKIVLWGGGGVIATIKNEIPQTRLVASRDGKLPADCHDIDILIWAAPRSLLTKSPKNCTIKVIFDLSYSSNSMGLELAKKNSIPYFSGLEMFKEQAQEQQIFWSQFDERK